MNIKCLVISLIGFSTPTIITSATTKDTVKTIPAIDTLLSTIEREFERGESADLGVIAEAMNNLPEEAILKILKEKRILGGEHNYDAERLWALHEAASRLGDHAPLALCLRRTNKFQTSFEAKMEVAEAIKSYFTTHHLTLPSWVDFDDLSVIEDKRLGVSNPTINQYFRVTQTKYTDDAAWCAAYAAAKMKTFDPHFTLPQNAFRAASFGGFNTSLFGFTLLTKNAKVINGRYPSLKDLKYLPDGMTQRHTYTIEDFRDKNKIPFGALVIFQRYGGGHVGFVVGTIKDTYVEEVEFGVYETQQKEGIIVLGGNQNDAVQFEIFYDLDKIRAVTIPSKFPESAYATIPEISNPYTLPEFYKKNKMD